MNVLKQSLEKGHQKGAKTQFFYVLPNNLKIWDFYPSKSFNLAMVLVITQLLQKAKC